MSMDDANGLFSWLVHKLSLRPSYVLMMIYDLSKVKCASVSVLL